MVLYFSCECGESGGRLLLNLGTARFEEFDEWHDTTRLEQPERKEATESVFLWCRVPEIKGGLSLFLRLCLATHDVVQRARRCRLRATMQWRSCKSSTVR